MRAGSGRAMSTRWTRIRRSRPSRVRRQGFTHLAFNSYAKPIDGGGASTPAVRDPKFRDALAYALDREAIIDAAVDGHATPGSTLIPPGVVQFHLEPSNPRRYDAEEASRRLGLPATSTPMRMGFARTSTDALSTYASSTRPPTRSTAAAVVVADDWEAVGIGVTPTGLEPDTLEELLYVPEVGGTAEYDVELWAGRGRRIPTSSCRC